jgi:predicted Zn-dependent protease
MISRRGLNLSTSEPSVGEEFDSFTDHILRITPGAEAILEDSARLPQEPVLAQAKALFWLFGQTSDAQEQAAAALRLAAADELNPRETLWQTALTHWQAKQFDLAARAFEQLTAEFPDDLLALKAAEFLYYILGQQHCGPRFLAHLERLRPQHGTDPDFLAMDAFAHELCGDLLGARRSAEAALEQTPFNPWAHHALEHVLLWEGNQEAAITLMQSWVADWEASARPIHSHNCWHLALALLDRLENTAAFEVFDAHVWLQTPDVVVEQLDSIALLWRAEMAGSPVSEHRWQALLPHISQTAPTLFMPFATAHYAYALARAGAQEQITELLDLVDRRARGSDAEATRVWAEPGRNVVQASAALGMGDASLAAHHFQQAQPRLTEIGGSDAQDDLFRFATLHSLMQSGQKSEARAYLDARLRQKTASPLEEKLQSSL